MIRYYGAYCRSATCSIQTTTAGDLEATIYASQTSMHSALHKTPPLTSMQRSLHVLHSWTSPAYPPLSAFIVWRPLPADHNAGYSSTLARPIPARERPSQETHHIAQEPRPDRSFQRRTPHILHKWRRHVPSALGVCEPASLMGAHLSRGYDPPD
jgi:hypothetical protein